jgi:hypothetical protein
MPEGAVVQLFTRVVDPDGIVCSAALENIKVLIDEDPDPPKGIHVVPSE